MQHVRTKPWKYEVALLFTVTMWGINFVVLKAALALMHLHVVNAFRAVVAAGVLGAMYVARQRRAGQSVLEPLRAYGWQIVALGLLGYVAYQYCFIVGIDHTTAGSAALIMAGVPLWTAVIGRLLGLDRLPAAGWVGLVLTLAGTVVIVLAGHKVVDFGSQVFFGNAMMALAAVLWGTYTALTRPILRHVSATGLTFLGLFVATPFLFAIAAPHFGGVAWSGVTPWVWVAIVFSGGISIGLAVVLWNAAVHAVGASHTAAYNNLVPVVALLSGYLWLDEVVTGMQLGGGALIIGGLVLMRRVRAKEARAAAPGVRRAHRVRPTADRG